MDAIHSTFGEEWARLSGLAPAELQALASQMLQENEARMDALRAHSLRVSRLHNSAALINTKLPFEILVEVFRLAGPLASARDAILLTHVCHAWRTLIHGIPVFWKDFLFPYPGRMYVGSTMKHPSVVLDALARTAPMRVTFALYGDFLPALQTPAAEAHLSRISSLNLDCRALEDRDMCPFFELSLPSLEVLRLRLHCAFARIPPDISAESPTRFPRLRVLNTTCAGFPLAWVGPSLRTLDILVGDDEAVTPYGRVLRLRCSCPRSVSDLFSALGRCADLQTLSLAGWLPTRPGPEHNPAVASDSPSPGLNHLTHIKIVDNASRVRRLLEHIPLPREAFVEICTDTPYDTLSDCLPVARPLHAIPLIDQLELAVCRPGEEYPHIAQGYAPEGDGVSRSQLAVLASDKTGGSRALDLGRLFRGFSPIFSSAALVDLDVTLCRPMRPGQSEAWVWLLGYFPRITSLSVQAVSSRDVFVALAQEGVAAGLSKLYVVLNGALDWVAECEEAASALEARAARGLILRTLSYRQQVRRGSGELPPSAPAAYVERMQAVVEQLTIPAPYYVG